MIPITRSSEYAIRALTYLASRDRDAFFARLVPDGARLFTHTAEGVDDMPSHVRSILTQASIGIPIEGGRADLGTWQGVYLYEHRHRGHRRKVTVVVS